MRFERIHVIINPASGHNEPILNTLNDVFQVYDVQWNVSLTHNLGDGARIVRQLADAGDVDLVLAYGGDGTLLDVVDGLLETGLPLGILPGGTANALADELNIPPTLHAAAQLACDDDVRLRTIDVGRTADRYFLLRVGTGMVGTFSEGVTRELKDRLGLLAYVVGGLRAFANSPVVDYTLTIDGEVIHTQGTACIINNGNAIGALGIRLNKAIRIDDGLLDVFVVNNDLQTAISVAGSLTNLDALAQSLQHWQGREITIEADPQQDVYGDGENSPFTRTPSTCRALKRALSIIIPPESL